MQPNSIEGIVEEQFSSVYYEAINKAELDFKSNILDRIENENHFEKFKILFNEDRRLKDEEESTNPFYTDDTDNYELLLKVFASRVILLNNDERSSLYQSVYHAKLSSLVINIFFEIKESIPKYTFNDFLKGKYDPYLFELEYFYHIPKDDYYKIRNWQSVKLIEIVSLESLIMISKIQEAIKLEINPQILLQKQKNIFEDKIHNQVIESIEDLKHILKSFVFLNGYNFEALDKSDALNDFRFFCDKEVHWGKICPSNINHIRKLYSANKKAAFSTSYLLFFSINKTIVWIENVLESSKYFEPFTYPDLKIVFKEALSKAESHTDKRINDLQKPLTGKSKSEKIRIVFDILENLRYEISDEDFSMYYYQVLGEDQVLENLFVSNAFLDNDISLHENYLIKAYSLNECIYYFWNLWEDLTGKVQIKLDGIQSNDFLEVIQLLKNMPFDPELYKRVRKILNKTIGSFHDYHIPIDFIQRNIEEEMRNIFFDSLENLSTYLEKSPHKNKLAYVFSRLKDLKKRELELKRYEKDPDFENHGAYTKLLREYLDIEAEYIINTKDLGFIPSLPFAGNEKLSLPENSKSLAFSLKSPSFPLLKLIEQLNLKVGLLNSGLTTPAELNEVLISPNAISCGKKIHFGCETVQLSYIISMLEPFFNNFNPASIGKSGLFFTKKGTPLTAQNIYKNKTDNPKEKEAIDKIFKQFQ
jgi:hypothetical protein